MMMVSAHYNHQDDPEEEVIVRLPTFIPLFVQTPAAAVEILDFTPLSELSAAHACTDNGHDTTLHNRLQTSKGMRQ